MALEKYELDVLGSFHGKIDKKFRISRLHEQKKVFRCCKCFYVFSFCYEVKYVRDYHDIGDEKEEFITNIDTVANDYQIDPIDKGRLNEREMTETSESEESFTSNDDKISEEEKVEEPNDYVELEDDKEEENDYVPLEEEKQEIGDIVNDPEPIEEPVAPEETINDTEDFIKIDSDENKDKTPETEPVVLNNEQENLIEPVQPNENNSPADENNQANED